MAAAAGLIWHPLGGRRGRRETLLGAEARLGLDHQQTSLLLHLSSHRQSFCPTLEYQVEATSLQKMFALSHLCGNELTHEPSPP